MGVAGAYAPAFVERARHRHEWQGKASVVSPELMLRPSLSGAQLDATLEPLEGCRRSLCSGLLLDPTLSR